MSRAVRLGCGSIVAIIGAAILAPGSAAQADATARDLARELCKTAAPGGATIQIVGPRLRWSAPVPGIDTKQGMQSLIGQAVAARGFLIDANGGWVTVHHIDTRTTVLMSCAGGEPFTAAHDFRPTAMAVSRSGDLALRTEVGDVGTRAHSRRAKNTTHVVGAREPGPRARTSAVARASSGRHRPRPDVRHRPGRARLQDDRAASVRVARHRARIVGVIEA